MQFQSQGGSLTPAMQAPAAGQIHLPSQSQVPSQLQQSKISEPANQGFPMGSVVQGPIPHLTQSNQNLAPYSQGQSTGVQNIVSPVGTVHNIPSLPPSSAVNVAPQVQVLPPPESVMSQATTQPTGQVAVSAVGSTALPRQPVITPHVSHPGLVTVSVPNSCPAVSVPIAVAQPLQKDGMNFQVSAQGQNQVKRLVLASLPHFQILLEFIAICFLLLF